MEQNQTNFTDYYYSNEIDDESENIADVDVLIDDDYIEQQGRWSRRRIVSLMVMLMIIIAILAVLFTPVLQNLISPAPTYIPPLSTPASQL